MKVADKLTKNTLFNVGGYSWGLLVSLGLTPYIISRLGIQYYGVWAIMGVVINYFSLLDIPSVGSSFVKYIAEFQAKKEFKSINAIIGLGLVYYFIFWMIISVVVFIFKHQIVGFFKMPVSLGSDIYFVLFGILTVTLIRGTFSVFRSVLLGLQRMDMTNMISIGTSLFLIAGTIIALEGGYGIKGLTINAIVVACLTVILQTAFALSLLSDKKLSSFLFSKKLFNKTFAFGVKIQIARFAEITNLQVDKILLGHFISMGSVTFYELGSKIANLCRNIPNQLLPAILPASSELDAQGKDSQLESLYFRGTKYISFIALPIAFFVWQSSPQLMLIWMGKTGFETAVLAIRWLVFAYLIQLLVSMGRLIARGMGAPQYEMKSSIVLSILNILFSILLIIKFGFIGALIGTFLAAGIASAYFLLQFHNFSKWSFKKLALHSFMPSLIVSIICAGVIFILDVVAVGCTGIRIDSRFSASIYTFANLALFSALYLYAAFKYNIIDNYDKVIITSALKLIFKRKSLK